MVVQDDWKSRRLASQPHQQAEQGGQAAAQAESVAHKMLQALASPMALAGHAMQSSCSIGVVLFVGDEASADDLMKHADSKYALAIFAAKRARQINSYFTQLNEGLLQNIGPLVEYQNNEKPLSIAFREIDEGLLEETLGEDDANEGN